MLGGLPPLLLFMGATLLLGGVAARRGVAPSLPWGVLALGWLLVLAGAGAEVGQTLAALGFTAPADALDYLTGTPSGRTLVLGALGATLLLALESPGVPRLAFLLPGALLLWGLSGAGHGADHGLPTRLAHVAHAGAAFVWIGGVGALLLTRAPLAAYRRFSPVAALCVMTVALSGALMSLRHLEGAPVAEALATPYGCLLLVKLGLVGVTLLLALLVRRRLSASSTPSRLLRAEVALLVAVLGTTAVLSVQAPPHGDHAMQARR